MSSREEYEDDEDEDLSPSVSRRSFIERRIIVQVAANREKDRIMSPISEEVEEEPDLGSAFYTSVPSIPPEHKDEQTETAKMVKRKISQIIVVYSDEIPPLVDCEDDTPTMTDISVTKDASTCTTKDAFEGIQRRKEKREEPRWKQESDVGFFVENCDKYVRKKSPAIEDDCDKYIRKKSPAIEDDCDKYVRKMSPAIEDDCDKYVRKISPAIEEDCDKYVRKMSPAIEEDCDKYVRKMSPAIEDDCDKYVRKKSPAIEENRRKISDFKKNMEEPTLNRCHEKQKPPAYYEEHERKNSNCRFIEEPTLNRCHEKQKPPAYYEEPERKNSNCRCIEEPTLNRFHEKQKPPAYYEEHERKNLNCRCIEEPKLNRCREKQKPPAYYEEPERKNSNCRCIEEPKLKRCDSKQFAEMATFSGNTERRDDFTRLSCIPKIIIGEIDKQEATYLYDQLLGVGMNFLDWLNFNHLSQSDYMPSPTTSQAWQLQRQQETTKTSEQAKVLQRKILSIEEEYNKLKREQNADCNVRVRKIDPCSSKKERDLYKSEEIKPEHIQVQPRVFSSQAQRNRQEGYCSNNMRHDFLDDHHCLPHPYIESTSKSNRRNTNNTHVNEISCCPCDIERRLVKLEQSFKNHDGDFTNVIAELRSCLEYCNSQQQQREDNTNGVIRARIAKLTDLVELHRKALDDWKVELCRLRKNSNSKK